MECTRIVISVFCIILSVLFYYFFKKEFALIDYCEHTSKSLLFNNNLCNDILQGNITVEKDYLQMFINLFSTKAVFRGKFNHRRVVLKTTIPVGHVKKMESEFLRIFSNISEDSNRLLFAQELVYSLISIPLGTPALPKLRLCPFNRSVEIFLNKTLGSFHYEVDDYIRLWTILFSNPEPLILKMLDPKVWPVPEYFGSCGQLIVVEDCGLTLTNFYDSDWNVRANLSYQLLENAFKFTFHDPDFALYMTDVSPDNIVVTEQGVVKYIDLEHIILTDRNSKGPDDWFFNHTSKHHDCPNCLKFEADEICSHQISDHNIYAVCKEILSDSELLPGGFLHSVPITQLYLINHFIEECIQARESSRFETAEKIMYLLKKYI